MAELRLIKVPRWLSDQWLNSKPQEIVADLDLEKGTLCTRGARTQHFRLERRDSPELFSFWQPLDGSEVPIEGPIVEALNVIPDLKDSGYRSLLQQRSQDNALASGSRSRHEEEIIQPNDGHRVTTRSSAPKTTTGTASAKQTSFEEVLSLVENALRAAEKTGLTGREIFERLPAGGCTLAQLRDALLALAVPAQDGSRRYVYAPCLGRAASGEMIRWSGDGAPPNVPPSFYGWAQLSPLQVKTRVAWSRGV
ncbi:unnamed protein product [Durusdinium trenchii]|uniref:Transcription initiation factor IIF subunit beta n=1 Tax=Durusdinium trenchii TaxID=1381693 RepID=A0ABP0NU56_9DINO